MPKDVADAFDLLYEIITSNGFDELAHSAQIESQLLEGDYLF